jgi:hypothetical protein
MDLSKLRTGELVAAIAGLVLIISLLFLNWYGVGGSVETPFGQGFFGTLANLVILAAGLAAITLAVLTATSRTVDLPVATSALTAGLGIAAVVMVVGRILMQPGPNGIVDLKFGIFVALIGAIGVAWGGWQAMQDEGTSFADARDRRRSHVGGPTSDAAPPPREEPAAPPPSGTVAPGVEPQHVPGPPPSSAPPGAEPTDRR